MATLIKVTLDWERDTKGFHVYRDPARTMATAVIYVPKRPGEPAPAQVTVTVES